MIRTDTCIMKRPKKSETDRLLDFIRLTHLFQQIKRVVRATGEMRWENDAEHSYQLALFVWYVINSKGLKLDLNKCILYALVHDLPEIYSGDPCAFIDGPQSIDRKAKREKAAIERLKRELKEFPDLIKALKAYERFEDPESCFVYVLDKLLPIYNIRLDHGRTWRQFQTPMDTLLAEREKKVRRCPIGSKMYDEIVIELKGMQKELFPPSASPLAAEELLAVMRPKFG